MPWRGMPRRSIRSRLIQLTARLRSSFVRVLPTINATVCGSRRSWMACPGMARDRSYHVSAHTIGRSSVREGHRQTVSSNCAIRGRAVPDLTARRPTIVWSASLISRSRAAQAWLLKPAATRCTSKRSADSSQDRRGNAWAAKRRIVPFAGAPGTRSAVLGICDLGWPCPGQGQPGDLLTRTCGCSCTSEWRARCRGGCGSSNYMLVALFLDCGKLWQTSSSPLKFSRYYLRP